MEGGQGAVVTDPDQRGHVEACSQPRSSAADLTGAGPRAAVAVDRRHTDESGDAATIELSQFGQLSDQTTRRGWPDAWHRGQQIHLFAPDRRVSYGGVQIAFDVRQVALQPDQMGFQALLEA